jgi:hypothetical protein
VIDNSGGREGGQGMAVAGIFLGWVGIVGLISIILVIVFGPQTTTIFR